MAGFFNGASDPSDLSMIRGEGEFINLGNEFRRTYRDAAKRGGPNLVQQKEATIQPPVWEASHRLNRSPKATSASGSNGAKLVAGGEVK